MAARSRYRWGVILFGIVVLLGIGVVWLPEFLIKREIPADMRSAAMEAEADLRRSSLFPGWSIQAVRVSPFSMDGEEDPVDFLVFHAFRNPLRQMLFSHTVRYRPYTLAVRRKSKEWKWVGGNNQAREFAEFLVWAKISLRTTGDAQTINECLERFVKTGGYSNDCTGQMIALNEWRLACVADCHKCAYHIKTDDSGQIAAAEYHQ